MFRNIYLRYGLFGLLAGLVLALILSIDKCNGHKEKVEYLTEDFSSISDYTAGIELELKNVENKLADCEKTQIAIKSKALENARKLAEARGIIVKLEKTPILETVVITKKDTVYKDIPVDLVEFNGTAFNADYACYYKGEFIGILSDDASLKLMIDSIELLGEPVVEIIQPDNAKIEQQEQRINELISTNNELGQSLARVSDQANAFQRWEVEAGVGAISNYASIDRVPQYGPMGALQFNVTKGLRVRGQYLYNWDRKNQEDAHVLQASLMVKLFGLQKVNK